MRCLAPAMAESGPVTDVINSMGSLKAQSADGVEGLNIRIPLTPDKRELYRQKLRPVVVDYLEY